MISYNLKNFIYMYVRWHRNPSGNWNRYSNRGACPAWNTHKSWEDLLLGTLADAKRVHMFWRKNLGLSINFCIPFNKNISNKDMKFYELILTYIMKKILTTIHIKMEIIVSFSNIKLDIKNCYQKLQSKQNWCAKLAFGSHDKSKPVSKERATLDLKMTDLCCRDILADIMYAYLIY